MSNFKFIHSVVFPRRKSAPNNTLNEKLRGAGEIHPLNFEKKKNDETFRMTKNIFLNVFLDWELRTQDSLPLFSNRCHKTNVTSCYLVFSPPDSEMFM